MQTHWNEYNSLTFLCSQCETYSTKRSSVQVPLKIATEENLRGLADKVTNYDSTNVVILPWQTNGRRQVLPGMELVTNICEIVVKNSLKEFWLKWFQIIFERTLALLIRYTTCAWSFNLEDKTTPFVYFHMCMSIYIL